MPLVQDSNQVGVSRGMLAVMGKKEMLEMLAVMAKREIKVTFKKA